MLFNFVHSPFRISTSRKRLANIELLFLSVTNFSHDGLTPIKEGPDYTEFLVKRVVRGKLEILFGVRKNYGQDAVKNLRSLENIE